MTHAPSGWLLAAHKRVLQQPAAARCSGGRRASIESNSGSGRPARRSGSISSGSSVSCCASDAVWRSISAGECWDTGALLGGAWTPLAGGVSAAGGVSSTPRSGDDVSISIAARASRGGGRGEREAGLSIEGSKAVTHTLLSLHHALLVLCNHNNHGVSMNGRRLSRVPAGVVVLSVRVDGGASASTVTRRRGRGVMLTRDGLRTPAPADGGGGAGRLGCRRCLESTHWRFCFCGGCVTSSHAAASTCTRRC